MTRTIVLALLVSLFAAAQPADAPLKFTAADVHLSPPSSGPMNSFMRTGPVHNGRYEIRNAAMLDLIQTAYPFTRDKILGGPSWLELDRYDVIARVPPETTPDDLKVMLQALLAERFHLVVHKESKPLPTYALTAGKKPLLKPAEASEEPGCKLQPGQQVQGGMRLMMGNADGTTLTLNLGPDMTLQYNCRNMSMASFVDNLHTMMGANLGPNPILDETGLAGKWDFDVRWSLRLGGGPALPDAGAEITAAEAVDKQLGLKLEQRQVPTPVLMVDKADEKPTANPPGTADILPPVLPPKEFEVASVKPAPAEGTIMSPFRAQPGGRLTVNGMNMRFLLMRAFNLSSNDEIAGLPAWADSDRFDIVAKAPVEAPAGPIDFEWWGPMIRSLLADRFKMTYHTEDRPVTAYSLVSAKPKLKKADPTARTTCKMDNGPSRSRIFNCQNMTVAQFAERLRNTAPDLQLPILDATGLEGSWDFAFTFSPTAGMMMGPGRGGGDAQPGAAAATDPSGAPSIFEALEKQLGLKLEKQKRNMPVIVIDHIEQKPTEN